MSIRFDIAKIKSSSYMGSKFWEDNIENLNEFLNILKSGIAIDKIQTFQKDSLHYYKTTQIYEILSTQYETLDNELYKAFKNIDKDTKVIE